MAHQCVKCSRIIPLASKELLEGCANCGGKFFFYINDEQLEQIKHRVVEIPEKEKGKIEKDIREIVGIIDEEMPVILDLESVRVLGDGKFEIDLVKVFNKERPLIYKLEEGKYIIDLASTLERSVKDLKEIQNPYEKKERKKRKTKEKKPEKPEQGEERHEQEQEQEPNSGSP